MNSRQRILLLVACFSMVGSVSSWGPKTQEYICQKAVTGVWGEEAFLNCFVSTRIDEICSLLDEPCREECARLTVMPWSIPDDVFNDSEKWSDYSLCHVSGLAGRYLCGNKSHAPALDAAQEWFTKAKNHADECKRLYSFCIGANYYAKRFFQPYQLKYAAPACEAYIRDNVDEKIGKSTDWQVRTTCNYEFWEGAGQKRKITEDEIFIVKQYKIDDIIRELVAVGENISSYEGVIGEAKPAFVSTTTSTSSSTTSTTIPETTTTSIINTVEATTSTSTSTTSTSTLAVPAQVSEELQDDSDASEAEVKNGRSYATLILVFVVFIVLSYIIIRRIRGGTEKTQESACEPSVKKHHCSLQDIKGLGRVAEDRLKSSGIKTLENLMERDAAEISAETEISEERIVEWKKKASDILDGQGKF
ncbi:MAG: helix-hairpin-helix domain-containing protein [Candidatus Altiarchaeota archaeon]